MTTVDLFQHFVCTHDQAWELLQEQERFWVSNCGCREDHGHCLRSRLDVCMTFSPAVPPTGSEQREITLNDAALILDEARKKQLVARPYHGAAGPETVEGMCFCCDDCCSFFRDDVEYCEKGELVEMTALDLCVDCGVCEEMCYFGARQMMNGHLVVEHERCYGCGQCLEVCTIDCIRLVSRN